MQDNFITSNSVIHLDVFTTTTSILYSPKVSSALFLEQRAKDRSELFGSVFGIKHKHYHFTWSIVDHSDVFPTLFLPPSRRKYCLSIKDLGAKLSQRHSRRVKNFLYAEIRKMSISRLCRSVLKRIMQNPCDARTPVLLLTDLHSFKNIHKHFMPATGPIGGDYYVI